MTDEDELATDLPYLQALDELDAILAEIDSPDVDVDVLAAKVARAAELIDACRARITAAELRVREITAAAPDADDPSGGSP